VSSYVTDFFAAHRVPPRLELVQKPFTRDQLRDAVRGVTTMDGLVGTFVT
jgi:hypothetical protein